MDPLQAGILISSSTRPGEALSARPDAPVVPAGERQGAGATTRVRLAGALHRLADGLYRVADAVAPHGAGGATRRRAYADRPAH